MVATSEGNYLSASSTLRAILSQFALDRAEGIPHAAVVRAMSSLGITSDSARQAISRAARSGALAIPPVARRGEVLLSTDGREALAMAVHDRVLDATPQVWDGKWSIIIVRGNATLSQPHRVRNRLLLEGLGSLGNGTWVTPHSDRSERLVALLDKDPALSLVSGQVVFDHPSDRDIAEQAWDLVLLRAEYEQFKSESLNQQATTDEECFAAWIAVVRQWQHVARMDPGIPEQAVGDGWPARGVQELVTVCRDQWKPKAAAFFSQVVTDIRK